MDEAISTTTNAALSGNPIAVVILIAALLYIVDKTWWHAKGKRQSQGGPMCDPEVIESLRKTAEIQKEILGQISDFRGDANEDHRAMLDICRQQKEQQAVLMDRLRRGTG